MKTKKFKFDIIRNKENYKLNFKYVKHNVYCLISTNLSSLINFQKKNSQKTQFHRIFIKFYYHHHDHHIQSALNDRE